MEMLISPLSAENRVIRDFWGIKIARDIRVIFYAYFPQSVYRISLVRFYAHARTCFSTKSQI